MSVLQNAVLTYMDSNWQIIYVGVAIRTRLVYVLFTQSTSIFIFFYFFFLEVYINIQFLPFTSCSLGLHCFYLFKWSVSSHIFDSLDGININSTC